MRRKKNAPIGPQPAMWPRADGDFAQRRTARLRARQRTPANDKGVSGMPMISMKSETNPACAGIEPSSTLTR